MRALRQRLISDLAHVRSRLVEKTFTSESIDDVVVTVKRQGDVGEGSIT